MTRHATNTCLILAIACAAAGCAAPAYNPPESKRGEGCPVDEVRVCRDRYPSRLERPSEPPMICTCERVGGIR